MGEVSHPWGFCDALSLSNTWMASNVQRVSCIRESPWEARTNPRVFLSDSRVHIG